MDANYLGCCWQLYFDQAKCQSEEKANTWMKAQRRKMDSSQGTRTLLPWDDLSPEMKFPDCLKCPEQISPSTIRSVLGDAMINSFSPQEPAEPPTQNETTFLRRVDHAPHLPAPGLPPTAHDLVKKKNDIPLPMDSKIQSGSCCRKSEKRFKARIQIRRAL